ncbi:hypothetical protein TNIN_42471 [Trichonephila inaurata madagascariensis]|uniref:Uncharacterized protein n=1 Tax=Trichonephila inaurata madagascariensis TaxID=2747483 RepID=A0A8X6X075_9ARAC|nr:hypothetical protein TNIN_42471 [Trichonephila inaurata madagascariensis]
MEARRQTENETGIREARHKEDMEARLKAEEEAKEWRKGGRLNKRIALEEEMRLRKERWLVEEQMRHVQEKHKMIMKTEVLTRRKM